MYRMGAELLDTTGRHDSSTTPVLSRSRIFGIRGISGTPIERIKSHHILLCLQYLIAWSHISIMTETRIISMKPKRYVCLRVCVVLCNVTLGILYNYIW